MNFLLTPSKGKGVKRWKEREIKGKEREKMFGLRRSKEIYQSVNNC
jgi:hypothetical protein